MVIKMCFSDDCDGYDMLGDLADTADVDMNDGCCDDICDYGDHGFWYV